MDQVSFVDALLPARFGRNARLERIAKLIDWAPIERLVADIHPGETGRPPYWPLAMFKALLLQQWYGLSDPGLEEALLDRVSFRRVLRLCARCGDPGRDDLVPISQRAEGGRARRSAVCRDRRAARCVGLCFTQGHADRRDAGCERCGGTAVGLDAEGRGKSLAARPGCQLDAPGTQPAFVFRLQASYRRRSRFGPDLQPLRNTGQDLKARSPTHLSLATNAPFTPIKLTRRRSAALPSKRAASRTASSTGGTNTSRGCRIGKAFATGSSAAFAAASNARSPC